MKQVFRRVSLIAIAIVMSLTIVPPVSADIGFRNNNDVIWTNPDSYVCGAGSGSGTKMSGDNNLAKIWNYLVDQERGLTDEQAAGVLGNIAHESGHSYSPFTQEYARSWPAGGYGLVQWTNPGRRDAVRDSLKEKLPSGMFEKYYVPAYGGPTKESNGYVPEGVPVDVNDQFLAIELDFLYAESTTRNVLNIFGSGTEWENVKKAQSVKEASDVWLFNFERPGSVISGGKVNPNTPSAQATSKARAEAGQEILDQLRGQSGGDVASASPASLSGSAERCSGENANPGSVQALQALTLKYAHPTKRANHSPGATTPTEEYRKAVDAAKSSGMYTGDQCYGGGIDCGAFVTLLLINSGWEPNYNYGGKIADGANNTTGGQRPWMDKNWEKLGDGGSIDTGALQPGDVAISDDHTFVYVGEIEGFDSVIASASQCGRAPSAGSERINDPGMVWYRKKAGSGVITGV